MITYIFIVKGELVNVTRAWDKEKNLRPRQESNPWPPEHKVAHYPMSYGELITEFKCDRRPELCKDSGGHGFDSCRGLRFFLSPTLVSCWFIHISHFFSELKIHHLYSLITRFLFAFRSHLPGGAVFMRLVHDLNDPGSFLAYAFQNCLFSFSLFGENSPECP